MMYMVMTRICLNYCGLDKGVSSGFDELSCAGWTLGYGNWVGDLSTYRIDDEAAISFIFGKPVV